MELVLTLPQALEEKLRKSAAEAGVDASVFALEALEEKLHGPRSLDEILAPFRKQVAQSGMSDAEMDEFYEGLREEVWQEKNGPAR